VIKLADKLTSRSLTIDFEVICLVIDLEVFDKMADNLVNICKLI